MKVKSFTVYFEIFGHKKFFTIESNKINSQQEAEDYVRNVLIPQKFKILKVNTNEEKTINKKDYDELWKEFDKTFEKIGKGIDAVFEKANDLFDTIGTSDKTKKDDTKNGK